VALLTGSTKARKRRSALADVFTGDAGILVGTHALLEDQVQFADLGLVVIDEQHRFGVEQRDALREKAPAARPHVLVMTATPIPRTVAMTVFGDLEVSTLTELPAGRSPITTQWCPPRSGAVPGARVGAGPGGGCRGPAAYVSARGLATSRPTMRRRPSGAAAALTRSRTRTGRTRLAMRRGSRLSAVHRSPCWTSRRPGDGPLADCGWHPARPAAPG